MRTPINLNKPEEQLDLKPCPFCGNDELEVEYESGGPKYVVYLGKEGEESDDVSDGEYYIDTIDCQMCGCLMMFDRLKEYGQELANRLAIGRWNTRAG